MGAIAVICGITGITFSTFYPFNSPNDAEIRLMLEKAVNHRDNTLAEIYGRTAQEHFDLALGKIAAEESIPLAELKVLLSSYAAKIESNPKAKWEDHYFAKIAAGFFSQASEIAAKNANEAVQHMNQAEGILRKERLNAAKAFERAGDAQFLTHNYTSADEAYQNSQNLLDKELNLESWFAIRVKRAHLLVFDLRSPTAAMELIDQLFQEQKSNSESVYLLDSHIYEIKNIQAAIKAETGRPLEAVKIWMAALKTAEEQSVADDSRIDSIRINLAQLHPDPTYAEALLVGCLSRIRLSDPDSPHIALIEAAIINRTVREPGDLRKALECYVELVNSYDGRAEEPIYLYVRSQYAEVLYDLDKFPQAISEFQAIREESKRLLGMSHYRTISAAISLARVYGKSRQIKLARRSLVELEGRDLPTQALYEDILFEWGQIHMYEGNFEEAKLSFREVERLRLGRLGELSEKVTTVWNSLAVLMAKEGFFQEALDLFQKIEQSREKSLGSRHPLTLSSRQNVVGALKDCQEYRRAYSLSSSLVMDMKEVFGDLHSNTIGARFNRAGLRLKLEMFDGLGSEIRDIIDSYKKLNSGKDTRESVASEVFLVHFYLEIGETPQLLLFYTPTLDRLVRELGADHELTQLFRSSLKILPKNGGF